MNPISQTYNMDCMEYMRQFPDKHFQLSIVDPPYGLDLANMNMGAGKSKKASKIQNRKWKPKDWDKSVPTNEYFNELFRISKNAIIWGGNYFLLPPYKNYVIWDKKIPKGLSITCACSSGGMRSASISSIVAVFWLQLHIYFRKFK